MRFDPSTNRLTRRGLIAGASAAALAGLSPSLLATDTPKPRMRRRFNVSRFIEDYKSASKESALSQRAVEEVLAREISVPAAVLAGVGAPQKGGIQTLYRSASLTILNIVWAPLMQLVPH